MMAPTRSFWVLLAGFCIQSLTFGPIVSLGVYFLPLRNDLHCTQREAAMFGSVAYGTTCLSGPLAAVFYHTIGPRPTVMIGGILAATGYACATLTSSIYQLACTQFLVGLGCGLAMTPGIAIQTQYFNEYKFFAVAFVTVGSATGIMLFPIFMLYLIRTFSWRGSMLIMSGIISHLVVCGALMKSNKQTEQKNIAKRVKSAVAIVCDMHLFRNLSFLLLCIECMTWGGCSYMFFSMVNALMVEHGVNSNTAAVLVSIAGGFNIAGRMLGAVVSHFPKTPRPTIYGAATLLLGTMSVLATLCYEPWTFGIVSALFGFGFGVMLSILGPVIIELFGADYLASAQGFAAFSVGIGGLIAPMIGGQLADLYNLKLTFYFAASLGIVAAFLCLLIVIREGRLKIDRRNIIAQEIDGAQQEIGMD